MHAKLSKPQAQFIFDNTNPYPCFSGGFGSGKTYALIWRALRLKKAAGPLPIAYYLPTYDLVQTIAYPRFEEVLTAIGWPFKLLRTAPGRVEFPGMGHILFRTMDTPHRIIGYEVADSLVDELDTLPIDVARHVWEKILGRNRAKKANGVPNTVAVATTPEGFRFVYDTWKRKARPGYRLIQASTHSNWRNIPEGYIQSLRDIYPEAALRAYLDGEFVNLTSGSVYPDFDRKQAHTNEVEEAGDVLHVGMDFNVMNMTALVCVIRNDAPVVVRELVGVRDTPKMVELLKARFPDHQIVVYPDASGKSRRSTNAQQSDLTLLREAGFALRVDPSNPPVKDRVMSVNAVLPITKVNTDNCPTFTESLEQQAYDKNGEPDKTSGHDHSTESFGYFVHKRWPVVRQSAHVSPLRL